MLRDYTGVLQTDGWEIYKSIADKINGITLIFFAWRMREGNLKKRSSREGGTGSFCFIKVPGVIIEIERQCKDQNLNYEEIKKHQAGKISTNIKRTARLDERVIYRSASIIANQESHQLYVKSLGRIMLLY